MIIRKRETNKACFLFSFTFLFIYVGILSK
jgi:hypothetical protein